MKARIKKTGEIVNVIRSEHSGLYVDENCVGYNLESLDFGNEEDDHWQDVRERAAIAAMQTLIAELYDAKNNYSFARNIAIYSVEYANELVKELRKQEKPK